MDSNISFKRGQEVVEQQNFSSILALVFQASASLPKTNHRTFGNCLLCFCVCFATLTELASAATFGVDTSSAQATFRYAKCLALVTQRIDKEYFRGTDDNRLVSALVKKQKLVNVRLHKPGAGKSRLEVAIVVSIGKAMKRSQKAYSSATHKCR
ncbi:MAG: hypothetical protein K8F25_06360 [Fimbriimonadaceae bacterium]|nr:hypothetical protein [Alphaproteobacteria bacterium]